MNPKSNLLAYLALGAVCIIWGTTYLALRVGVTQFPPFLFSGIRFLLAGPILLGLLYFIRKPAMPSRKIIAQQAVSGLLLCTFGVGIVGWSEMFVSSGLAAIICSVMPIWVMLINFAISSDDQPALPVVLGLVIGLAGIVLIFGEHVSDFSDPNYTLGIFTTFLGNICWAFGTVWVKKKTEATDPFLAAGLQMLFGGLFLLPMSLLFDDYSTITTSGDMLFALGYLILFGSVAAYASYSYAIKKLPMTLVSLYAYINPIVAVVLGALLLSERLNLRIGIGILITLAGIYVVNRGYQIRTFLRTQFSKE
ncbi:MAG: EamA family transporter [Cyclobacteriaceae bacterium]|nr:EamA family transporter [Cyclobacteriaceae bacterium]